METAERSQPVLTPEEWAAKRVIRSTGSPQDYTRIFAGAGGLAITEGFYSDCEELDGRDAGISIPDLPALIALANAALPDDDPRKITRARVDALRAASRLNPDMLVGYGVPLHELADALESYLPPE